MSENKFIKHLKGKSTAGSLVEIQNQSTPTAFSNMPYGTSNANDVFPDHRGNATGVLKGTENWKLNGQNLVETTAVYGDGRDFTDSFNVFGNGLWVNATCTFATARRFSPNTKFVLKLCGHDLETVVGNTIDFTLIVKFGVSTLISKTFTVTEQAFNFCKEFVIDFAESNSSTIKADAGSTMQIQLLCADASAQAVIYNGMTVFTALQRRVDGDAVASDKKTFDEVVDDVEQIQEDLDDLEEYVDDTFVRLDGESIMTGPLKMRATSSFQCAIAPFWDGVGFFKLNSDNSVTLIASIDTPDGFLPWTTNTYNIGSSLKKWKNLYLAGKMYVATINNGYDISVPVTNSADTFALVNKDIDPLQQQINHLQTIGRFLSFWDATTGLAQTNPQTSPYIYQAGDYFRVGVVAGPGGTNYKPSGSSYTIGVASTTVETERLSVGQVYYYDGANWALAGGGSVAIDETTIVFDSDDKIQAVATVNKNTATGATNPVYDWIGTLAQYNAQNIKTLHPDWLCFITDDSAEIPDEDLAYKANTDADNFTDAGTTAISAIGRYSNRFEQLQVVHGASYTAPETGFFTLDAVLANEAGNRLYLLLRNKKPYVFNNKTAGMVFGALSTYRQYTWIPVEKGDQVVITAQSTATSPDFNLRFFYANGVPTKSPTFTEVEYIEGTYNTQYLKSGIVTDSSMKLYCKIQNLGNSSNFGWGARNVTFDGSQMSINATNQNVVIDWFGATASDRWTVSTSVTSSDIFELTIENNVGVLAKNGTNIATHTFTPTATITRELYITGFNNNGVIGVAGAKGRLYAFKLWDSNNNLILDMVPAKDSSGVACVYNRATNTLYYNQGIGTYTAGPEV